MFVHSVYFWLREELSEFDVQRFKQGLLSLTSIQGVKHGFVGVPAPTYRPIIDRSYSYALTLTFENQQAHDHYQQDDVHERFRQDCSSLWSKVLIFDCV